MHAENLRRSDRVWLAVFLSTVAFFWVIIVALALLFSRLRGYPRIGA